MSYDNKILVAGATGMFGGQVVRSLLERGVRPKGLTRSEKGAASLESAGATPVIADMTDQAALQAGLEGVERAFLVSPMQGDLNILERGFIDAAKAAGVKHVVKLFGCVDHGNDPLNSLHLDAIEKLKQSGMKWTLVSPNTVMESNFFPHAETVKSEGKIYASAGQGKIGFVSLLDCGEVAAEVLLGEGHEGQDHQVTGPESHTFSEVAGILSTVLGKTIIYEDVPEPEMLGFLQSVGMSAEEAEIGVLCHYRLFREGKASLVTDTVQRLLGRPAVSVRDFFERNVESFR